MTGWFQARPEWPESPEIRINDVRIGLRGSSTETKKTTCAFGTTRVSFWHTINTISI